MTRIHQEDGTRDKLMLAFGALDADGDKKPSYGRVPARGGERGDGAGPRAGARSVAPPPPHLTPMHIKIA